MNNAENSDNAESLRLNTVADAVVRFVRTQITDAEGYVFIVGNGRRLAYTAENLSIERAAKMLRDLADDIERGHLHVEYNDTIGKA